MDRIFISLLAENPIFYILWVIIIMFSICFHEFAHAYVALKQGDSTAAERGHLSLNPMVQMGAMSIIMLLIIGISWGAVPVNPSRMRRRYSHALVSFAGPAANILLFFVFCFLDVLFQNSGIPTYNQMFLVGAVLNAVLFLFNMLPIPILDGWIVFNYFIPILRKVNDEVKNAVTFLIFILFFMTPLFGWFFAAGNLLRLYVVGMFETIL